MNRDTRIQKLREAIAAQLGDAYYPTIEGAEAILDAVFEEANTPTDDEREALLESAAENYRPGYRDSDSDRDYWEAMAYKDGLHDGLHRTVQGEPTPEAPDLMQRLQDSLARLKPEVQGEPSDEVLDRALVAIMHDPEIPTGVRPHLLGGEVLVIRERTDAEPIVRAALRAAAATEGGEGR